MRVKLKIRDVNLEAVCQELALHGIEVSQFAPLTLVDTSEETDRMILKRIDSKDKVTVIMSTIMYVVSLGSCLVLKCKDESSLNFTGALVKVIQGLPYNFLQISNDTIINLDLIDTISAGVNATFEVTLLNGAVFKVTRTHYYQFKKRLGI